MVLLSAGINFQSRGRHTGRSGTQNVIGRPDDGKIRQKQANPNWKKGFYFIALKAQVPIVMIGIDYTTKTISATKAIMPSGDIEKDMREVKLYYKDFKGKNPKNFALGNIW